MEADIAESKVFKKGRLRKLKPFSFDSAFMNIFHRFDISFLFFFAKPTPAQ